MRDFFYCGFSNILKNCSIWLQKSNKPTRDLKKKPTDPFIAFFRQVKTMLRGNADLKQPSYFNGIFIRIKCQVKILFQKSGTISKG